ncbi:hypothetical protein Tco_0724958 [Tanacetum coccineum]|uniref:Uncharacterized protein n=1 Tax=Tanacetum coccineum TaxID=301880 RepID=A0ABQ4YCF7_9ASTR
MADVRRLSAYVIKLRDMPKRVLVLSGLSRVWKSRVCDLVLQGVDRNVMDIHDFLCLPEWTGAECCYSGSYSGGSCRGSAMSQSSASTTRPSLFVDNSDNRSDDDDVCVKILLVTPIRSTTVIPSSEHQGGSFIVLAAEGLGTRDSRGKGIMADNAATAFVGVSRPRPSSRPAPSFRDVSGDVIHTNFFTFLPVLIMPLILKVVLLGITSLLVRSGMLCTGLLLGF